MMTFPRQLTSFAALVVTASMSVLAGCSAAPTDGDSAAATNEGNEAALSTGSYEPSVAVSYANAHWSNGVGLCAEFVSDCLRAGHLDIPVLPYVPNLVKALAGIDYEEHAGNGQASASGGDVVVFSNSGGSSFCGTRTENCSHTCMVVTGGSSTASIEVDCHNRAHEGMVLSSFLREFPHYRIYHVASGSSGSSGSGGGTGGDPTVGDDDDDAGDDTNAHATSTK